MTPKGCDVLCPLNAIHLQRVNDYAGWLCCDIAPTMVIAVCVHWAQSIVPLRTPNRDIPPVGARCIVPKTCKIYCP
jgi:hypothetical protein